jgi:hypothetical protein
MAHTDTTDKTHTDKTDKTHIDKTDKTHKTDRTDKTHTDKTDKTTFTLTHSPNQCPQSVHIQSHIHIHIHFGGGSIFRATQRRCCGVGDMLQGEMCVVCGAAFLVLLGKGLQRYA